MQPDQQQRIMGYFIEEAKDHLNTIEQGLLSLQSTIADSEMVNEVFRAAHSIKGGAAMLGIHSIQRTAHSLEDYFKILKESPAVKVDQKLETLFLNVFDALQELLEQLQGPFGLTEEIANQKMANVEPVFGELDRHLQFLVAQVEASAPVPVAAAEAAVDLNATYIQVNPQESALLLLFQRDVPTRLRDMLQLFKQPENQPGCREQLQDLCRGLESIGDQFNLTQWCQLLEMAKLAIANPDNSYRMLAPIIIKDIKHAQDLVLEGRSEEIVPCEQLQALIPQLQAIVEEADTDFDNLFSTEDITDAEADLFELQVEEELASSSDDSVFDSWSLDSSGDEASLPNGLSSESLTDALDQNGPEVGMAELNSLADLFEGEVPDLGSTWQEEEIIADMMASEPLPSASVPTPSEDASNDFSDLLFEVESPIASDAKSDADDLIDLFGDSLQEEETEIDANSVDAFDLQSELLEETSAFSEFDEFTSPSIEDPLGDLGQLFDDEVTEADASLDSLQPDTESFLESLAEENDPATAMPAIAQEIVDPWGGEPASESVDALDASFLASETSEADWLVDDLTASSAIADQDFDNLFDETASEQALGFSEIAASGDSDALIELLSEDETDYSQLFEDSEQLPEVALDPMMDESGVESLLDEPNADSEIDALVDQAVADLEMEDILGSVDSDASIEELSLDDAAALDDSLSFAELTEEISDSVSDPDLNDALAFSELTELTDDADLAAEDLAALAAEDLSLDDALLFEGQSENSGNLGDAETGLEFGDSLDFTETPDMFAQSEAEIDRSVFSEGELNLDALDLGLNSVPDPWNEADDLSSASSLWDEAMQPATDQPDEIDFSAQAAESIESLTLDQEDLSDSLFADDQSSIETDSQFDLSSALAESESLTSDEDGLESFAMADSELEALDSLDFSTNSLAESDEFVSDQAFSDTTLLFDSMDSAEESLDLSGDLDALLSENDATESAAPMETSNFFELDALELDATDEFDQVNGLDLSDGEAYSESDQIQGLGLTDDSSTDLADLDDLFGEEIGAEELQTPLPEADDFFGEGSSATIESTTFDSELFGEDTADAEAASLADDFFGTESLDEADLSLESDGLSEAFSISDSSLESDLFGEDAANGVSDFLSNEVLDEALLDATNLSLESDLLDEVSSEPAEISSLESDFFGEESLVEMDIHSSIETGSASDSDQFLEMAEFSSEDLSDLFSDDSIVTSAVSSESESLDSLALDSLALDTEEMELLELHSAENGLEGFDLNLNDNLADSSDDLFDLELQSEQSLGDATGGLFESSADLDALLGEDLDALMMLESSQSPDEMAALTEEEALDLDFLTSDELGGRSDDLSDLDEFLSDGTTSSTDSVGSTDDLDDLLSLDISTSDDAPDLLEAPLDFEVSAFAADSGEDFDLLGLNEIDALELDNESISEETPLDFSESLMGDLEMPDILADSLDAGQSTEAWNGVSGFDSLDALLDSTPGEFPEPMPEGAEGSAIGSAGDDFSDLEALLEEAPPPPTSAANFSAEPSGEKTADLKLGDEFDDLDKLLEDANEKLGGSPAVKSVRGPSPRTNIRKTRPRGLEQLMRVPVKHLDNLSNLVGELVVNRNSLEQDQERLRQSLDNLLYQVQQLSDVGQRMQDLYERSLLESSLLASRQGHRSLFSRDMGVASQPASSSGGVEYDPLEMDRFTGFHSLSQEMIELIVRVRESASDIEFIVDETDQVTRMFRQVTTQLQEGLTRSRMIPFAQMADRLPRAVRDNAIKYKKQATLRVEGRETLIDKMILDQLTAPGGPLDHLINNAIAHGIEVPEIRQAAGKPPAGQITVSAFHQGNQTVISISDDGAGVDIDRVKAKAIEKGLITPAESRSMSRLDVYELLFHPGFSTKDQADDLAGRGVGMDVVLSNLGQIRGSISTDSSLGKGTTFTIRLPLTLSISKALCCISDRSRLAFPMDGVEDMLDLPRERVQTNAEGHPCISWRDTLLPLRPLNELLTYNRHLSRGNVYGGNQEEDIISVVVLRSSGNFLALQVDQVLGEQEIVIKQLEGPVPKPVGVAGATVLGDGRIMPIADVLELIDLSMGRIRRDVSGMLWDQSDDHGVVEPPVTKSEPMVLIVDDSITVRELLSMTFNKVGYRVEQARDGQEAWEKLRSGLPCDIVFCDIEMPRMDGLELLSRIQKDPSLSHLPIAMLTSRGADRHRQMAASLGASGYFTKPYLEEALLDAAQRMLKGEVLLSSTP